MAEAEEMLPAIRASMRLRHRAAIGRFRQILASTAALVGTDVVGATTAGSTSTCSTCGSAIVNDGSAVLVCASGHALDQDVNAARNLFSQIAWADEQTPVLRTRPDEDESNAADIPLILRAVVVVVHAG